MKADDLLEMKLKDILEEFCVVYSAECDYVYGITTHDAINEIAEKWDICDEPSFEVVHILPVDYLAEIEEKNDILTAKKLDELIEHNLPLELKNKE